MWPSRRLSNGNVARVNDGPAPSEFPRSTGTPRRHAAPPSKGRFPVRSIVRGVGEVAITIGMVLLLFAFYAVYVTDWQSARKQKDAEQALERGWQNPRGVIDRAPEGDGFAKMYVPTFGSDWDYTIVEGTSENSLEIGPGHYTDTALPGERGNFAVAGHRVGKGSPFNDLGDLESCDAVVIENASTWYVYRVLPMPEEIATWDTGRGTEAKCEGVSPLAVPYDAPGRSIVQPSTIGVISAVPGASSAALPTGEQQKLITLTTCHPKFSAKQRMIIHGVLVDEFPKVAGQSPPVLRQG